MDGAPISIRTEIAVAPPRLSLTRAAWVIAHRWAGLTLAVFLTLAGATGALLAFYDELYAATAPWMRVAPPAPDAAPLDPVTLLERAQSAAPEAEFTRVELDIRPDRALVFYAEAKGDAPLPYDEIALDPYTGEEVYRGRWGDLKDGWRQIMPFVFSLHYTFALGEVGRIAFGLAALVWTLDCFIGFYLTLPPLRRGWPARWRKAWTMRLKGPSAFRLSFDLHRAGGLWLWPVLLVFAWSSVGLNLTSVYDPVMAAFGRDDVFAQLPDRPAPDDVTHDWRARLEQARALAEARGADVVAENGLSFRNGADAYEYRYRDARDLPTERGQSRLFFDRETGALVAFKSGRGDASANGVHEWLVALHIASIGGLPYRIFVAVLGLGVVMLSVTGVVIWMKKRSARIARGRTGAGVLENNRSTRPASQRLGG